MLKNFIKNKLLVPVGRVLRLEVPLIDEICHNRVEDVKLAILLKQNLNFNRFPCEFGFVYPLHLAVFLNRKDIVKLMLEGGADPNFVYIDARRESRPQKKKDHGLQLFEDEKMSFSKITFDQVFRYVFPPKACKASNEDAPPASALPALPFESYVHVLSPTNLALLLGNAEILSLCLDFGGKVCLTDCASRPLVSFFLDNFLTSRHFSLDICKILFQHNLFTDCIESRDSFFEFFQRYKILSEANFGGQLEVKKVLEYKKIVETFVVRGFLREFKSLDLFQYGRYYDRQFVVSIESVCSDPEKPTKNGNYSSSRALKRAPTPYNLSLLMRRKSIIG